MDGGETEYEGEGKVEMWWWAVAAVGFDVDGGLLWCLW